MGRYTKAQLEELVYCQLENLDAMHDLIRIIKHQNELLASTNKKLSDEISEVKKKHVMFKGTRRKDAAKS